MIISAIIIIVKQYGSDKKDKIIQLGMLFLPTMGFFLIVVRTVPYITDRYYFGIGAVIAVFIVCIVSIILQYLVKTRLHNAFLLSLCVVLPIAVSYTHLIFSQFCSWFNENDRLCAEHRCKSNWKFNDPGSYERISLTAVSYTHLDVYKRQVFMYTAKAVGRYGEILVQSESSDISTLLYMTSRIKSMI